MAKQLNSYEVKLDFKADTSQAKKEIQSLQQNLSDAIMKAGTANVGQGLSKQLSGAIAAASQLKIQLQEAFNVDTGRLDLGRFKQSMDQSGMSLRKYQEQLSMLGPEGEQAFRQLASSVVQAEVPLKRSNALLTEFATTLKNTARWQISSSLLHGFMGAMSSAYGYAQDLNESLNNIRIVTGYNVDQMSDFAAAANKAAQALSTTTTSYTDAALIYYQQGLSDEEVLGRTDVTIKLANVARESAETVSDQMTAVWNNFYDGSKSLEYYADVMTALGAATASSTSEISQGLEKFAAVADTVGLSYEYATAALATVTATTRQSADVVGTAFKTLFARLEQLKLGETLDDGTTLGQYSQALEKVGVLIKDDAGNLKDMDDILDELAAKWQTLAKDQQVALAQQVAGVRQYTQLIALMDNWDFMESNLEVARGAEGTLEEQADIYAESWEAAQKRVKAAAEDIYGALLDDKFFISLNNALADLLKNVKLFIDGIGGVKGVIMTLGALFVTIFQKDIANSIDNTIYRFKTLTEAGRKSIETQKQEANELLKASYGGKNDTVSQAMIPAVGEQVKLQETYLKYADKLTDAQRKQAASLMDQQQILIKNIELKAEELQKTEQETKALERRTINQVGRQHAKGLGKSAFNDVYDRARSAGKVDETINTIDSVLTKNSLSGEKGVETLQLLDKTLDELSIDAKDFEKAYGTDAKEAYEKFIAAVKSGNIKEADKWSTKLFDIQGLERELDQASQRIKKALEDTFGPEKAEEYSKAIDEAIEKEKELGAESIKLGRNQLQLATYTEKVEEALKKIVANNTTVSQSISALSSTFLSVGSSIRMVTGLFKTLSDDSLSASEKIGQALSTIAMLTLTLTRVKWDEIPAHVGNITAILAEKIAHDKDAVATFKNAASHEALTASIKANMAALSPYIATIGLTVATIAGLIYIIYNLVKAHQAEINKIKDAEQATNELKENYEKLNNAAKEFADIVKDYKDGVNALEDLKDNQEEYNKALKESNERARDLIETYGLFGKDQSYTENGILKITDSALQNIQDQKDAQARQSRNAYLQSALYTNELKSKDIYKNIGLGTESDNRRLLDAYKSWSSQNYSGTNGGTTSFKDFIDQNKDAYDGLNAAIDKFTDGIENNLIKSLEENSQALQQTVDAEEYYLKELIDNKLQEESSLKELATINGTLDDKLYRAILSAYTDLNYKDVSDKLDSGTLAEITQVDSLSELSSFLNGQGFDEATLQSTTGLDIGSTRYSRDFGESLSLSKEDVEKLYAKYVLGTDQAYNDSSGGFNTFYDAQGQELTGKIADAAMYQEVAKQLVASIKYELNNLDSESLDGFIENAKNVGSEYGLDLATSLTEQLTNGEGTVNLSEIFSQLSQAAYEGININELLDKLFEGLDLEEHPELQEFKEQIANAWSDYSTIDNTDFENVAGEQLAEQLGLNVDAFKLYRKELEDTYPELAKNAKAANDVAIANMRLAKGVNSILDNWEEYNEILSDSNAQFEDVANVTADMKEALEDMLNIDASTFELLPPDFAQKNWKLITDAVNGVEGKVDELRDKAGEEILLNVAADDTDLQNKLLELHNFLSEYNNNPNFEINVPIAMEGNEEFYAKCQEIINAAGFTAEQAQKYFASMGYDVEFHEATTPEVTRTHRQHGRWFDPETREWMDIDGSIDEYEPAVKGTAIKTITPNGNYGGNVAVKRTGGGGGGSKGGGGGGKSSSPAESQKVTSKADAGIKRYKEIDDAIQDLTKDQERLNKVTDAYYGANKISYMKQQLQLLGKEVELHKERFKWAQEYYNEDKADLDNFAKQKLGVEIKYDEDGSIKNYTSIMDQLYNQLNDKESYWANAANFSSKEAQDEYKKTNVDPIADTMKEFQKYVDAFDESNEERKKEMDEVIALQIEYKEHEYEIWQEGWKMQQEIIEDQVKFLDHAKKMIGDSAIEMGEILALTYGNDSNYIQNTTNQLELYRAKEEELHQLLEDNKITQADYIDGLMEIRDQYLKLTENLKELDDFMMEYYGKVLDKVIDEVKEYTDRMKDLNEQLSIYQKIMKLTGRSLDYEGLDKILNAQLSIYKNQYSTDKETYKLLLEQKEEMTAMYNQAVAENNEAGIELYKKQLDELEEHISDVKTNILNDLANMAEKAEEIRQNQYDKAYKDYEDMMTNGMGFEYLDRVLEHTSQIQDEYLTKTNQVFETTKMLRKIQSDMDSTSNRAAKERLNNFKKEIEQLKNREKMTKADLELAQKEYDLLLAKIALEEAQQAKTTVRLQRDNEGNYGYVYTADEGNIAQAEDDYFNAENDLYNTRLRITNEYGQKILELSQQQANDLQALWEEYHIKGTIDEDTYNKKKAEILNYYQELMGTYTHNYAVAQQDDSRVIADAWINKSQESSGIMIKDWVTVSSQWGKTEASMSGTTLKWSQATSGYIGNVEKAEIQWQNTSQTVTQELEKHFGNVDIATATTKQKSQELAQEIRDDLRHEYRDLFSEVDQIYRKYGEERNQVKQNITAYTTLAQKLQVTIDKYRTLNSVSGIKTYNSDGDKKDTPTGVKEILSTPTQPTGSTDKGKTPSYTPPYTPPKQQEQTQTKTADEARWTTILTKPMLQKFADQYIKGLPTDKNNFINKYLGRTKNDLLRDYPTRMSYIASLYTGGYTGEWLDNSGKLAVLHSKELVLNAKDTENMLAVVDMVREITKTIDVNAAGLAGSYGALSSGSMNAGPQTLEQNVQITASFPNATNHSEIEEAFNNLINKASQYANRTR